MIFRITLLLLLAIAITDSAWAQSATLPYFKNITNSGSTPVTPISPLPVSVYGGASATSGYVYTSNGPGAAATFQPTAGGGSGTVTSIAATGANGITVSGSPITTSGTLAFGLGAITPTSVSTGTTTITSNSATALVVGPSGATNPVLNIDASATSAVTGVDIVSAASGGTTAINATGPNGTSAGLSLNALGAANVFIGNLASTNTSIAIGNNTAISNILVELENNGNEAHSWSGTTRFNTNGVFFNTSPGTSSTASLIRYLFTPAADTALTASQNAVFYSIAGSGVARTHATGALTLQTDINFGGTTDAFAAASTLTEGASVQVTPKSCGANGTCITEAGIYIPATAITATNGVGLDVSAPTGATNNYAALFRTGGVGIGSANPAGLLDVGSAGQFSISSSGNETITSSSAPCLAVGPTGATAPAFSVSCASATGTGVLVTGGAGTAAPIMSVTGTTSGLTINSGGNLNLNSSGSGSTIVGSTSEANFFSQLGTGGSDVFKFGGVIQTNFSNTQNYMLQNVAIGTTAQTTGSDLTLAGHLGFSTSIPTVSSCGGGTLVTGSVDNKWSITGVTAATACTVTFSSPLPTAPVCVFNTSTGIAVGGIATTTGVTTAMAVFTGTLQGICL